MKYISSNVVRVLVCFLFIFSRIFCLVLMNMLFGECIFFLKMMKGGIFFFVLLVNFFVLLLFYKKKKNKKKEMLRKWIRLNVSCFNNIIYL